MGLKKMIRDLIPIETLHVLQKEKCISRYVDAVYDSLFTSSRRRSSEDTKIATRRVKITMKCRFWFTFDAMSSKEGYDFWQEIDSKIKTYQDLCRL